MTRVFIPERRRRIKLLQDWRFTLIKDVYNAALLADYVKLKHKSFKLADLEKWRAVKDAEITLLKDTRLHVETYLLGNEKGIHTVKLRLRDVFTNSWTPAQRLFRVTLADFSSIDCEYVE